MTARGSKLRILVLRDPGFQMDDSASLGEVSAALGESPNIKVSEATAGYGEGARAVQRSEADMVIIDEVAGDPSAVVEQIEQIAPELPIIVVLGQEEEAMAQACILAGARAYLFRPFNPADLLEIIERIQAKEDRRRKLRTARSSTQWGKVIAVHGAKGGVGATAVAVNLAVAARQLTGQCVALVDVNLLGGDVGVALNLVSDNSIGDVVAHLRQLDSDLLTDTMVQHRPSGVLVLLSPNQLERAEVISGEETASVLTACRAEFDLTIVDTSSRLDEHTLAALDLADGVLLICTPEIASLKNAARFLRLGQQLGYGSDKTRLVINRHNSHGSIPLAEIEANLGHKMSFSLSSDSVPMIESLNAGEPVVSMRPRSRIARELRSLTKQLTTEVGVPVPEGAVVKDQAVPAKNRGPFGFLRRLRPASAATAAEQPLASAERVS